MQISKPNLLLALVGAFLIVCAEYAVAQSSSSDAKMDALLEGTIYTVPHRDTVEGKLTACGVEFAALKRDFKDRKGELVRIVGSFYIRPDGKGTLYYLLKLGVTDMTANFQTFAPYNAFVSTPNDKVSIKPIRTPAETTGYALFGGPLDSVITAVLIGIQEKKQLNVGFNRVQGQTDFLTKVDLTVIDTQLKNDVPVRERSNETVATFNRCMADLISPILK